MLFPTVAFAIFFVIAFTANWILRPTYRVWALVMIGLSLWFYGAADPRFVLLLVGSAVLNWGFGAAIGRARQSAWTSGSMRATERHDRCRRRERRSASGGAAKRGLRGRGTPTAKPAWPGNADSTATSTWLTRGAVAANLGVLGGFKYYGFFVTEVSGLGNRLGLGLHPPLVDVLLPVGISFFTFHAVSYVIDISRGELRPMALLDFTLYLSFFPHLVAGPIVRAREFAPQLDRSPDPRRVPAAEALQLIAGGLFKKVVISSFLATHLVDPAFGQPSEHGALDLLIAVYAYAIQIYADFSGYTDIAIGCALLLGFRFPQNFNAPYRALSLQDFWRRWHMTLSRWLRDYLYIPLGGSRDGVRRTYRNLFLTMLLGGLWHGAAWTFVAWGAIHGGFLALERFASGWWRATHPEPALPMAASNVLRWLVTFHVVCLAWIFFRAESLGTAFEIVGRILDGRGPTTLVTGVALAVIVVMLAAQFIPDEAVRRARRSFGAWTPAAQICALVLALTVTDAFGPDGVAPFIYFRF